MLWHIHFRDSNSLTPGYGIVDFKAVIRALKKIGYEGYGTIENAPKVPDADTAAQDGIDISSSWSHRRIPVRAGVP